MPFTGKSISFVQQCGYLVLDLNLCIFFTNKCVYIRYQWYSVRSSILMIAMHSFKYFKGITKEKAWNKDNWNANEHRQKIEIVAPKKTNWLKRLMLCVFVKCNRWYFRTQHRNCFEDYSTKLINNNNNKTSVKLYEFRNNYTEIELFRFY